jgi:hypothetical protein
LFIDSFLCQLELALELAYPGFLGVGHARIMAQSPYSFRFLGKIRGFQLNTYAFGYPNLEGFLHKDEEKRYGAENGQQEV